MYNNDEVDVFQEGFIFKRKKEERYTNLNFADFVKRTFLEKQCHYKDCAKS